MDLEIQDNDQPPPTPKIEVLEASLSFVRTRPLFTSFAFLLNSHICSSPSKNLPSSSAFSGQIVGKHPVYGGIRCAVINGYQRFRAAQNYVLEYGSARTTPEMAAAAFDVPLLALKGINANLNFPNSALSFHIPKSTSAGDIRAAVVSTAKAQQAKSKNLESPDPIQPKKEKTTQLGSLAAGEDQFIEEEELLSMPNLPVDKAEGMLVSLSRLKSQTFDEGIFILFFTFHLFA
ncbi:Ethylene-responsive transcription factor ERF025 [Vitis vinifera]|uniref:Ethylene-responsive transcription factor ERF025 n=1 Tax=Vitis vinifera TaxID=29760 RepID=A0A438CZ97_VITVI|nr:Ethylene-responsive transcription factor ERF025 [Vitis vinifera]